MNKKTMTHDFDEKLARVLVPQDLDLDTNFKRATSSMFSTWIRVLEKNWQQGTVACQGRSDVSRTNKKPYKQKGTGRARAGDAKSPLWKGGGVIFGPQGRVRTLKMDKKMKRKVLVTMLAEYIERKRLICAQESFSFEKPKTAIAYNFLSRLGLTDKKVVLFVEQHDFLVAASFANLPNVQLLSFDQANAYELANSDCWLFLNKDFEHFKNMVSQWV